MLSKDGASEGGIWNLLYLRRWSVFFRRCHGSCRRI